MIGCSLDDGLPRISGCDSSRLVIFGNLCRGKLRVIIEECLSSIVRDMELQTSHMIGLLATLLMSENI